jgi:ADP-ribosylglycohydrolase
MLGTILGDVIGSKYEHHNIKTKEFELFDKRYCKFTDDTVLTIAVANKILNKSEYVDEFDEIGNKYFNCGFGGAFKRWLKSVNKKPYGSYGNGAAMRISPVAYIADNLKDILEEAKQTTNCTHNHPESIKGAGAVATAIFLAKNDYSKEHIKETIEKDFGYDLNFTLDEIRPNYSFDVSCQGSVPQAIKSFLEANCFEDVIRTAISIGGDSDTISAIAGSIAEAYYFNNKRRKLSAGEIEYYSKIINQALLYLPNNFLDTMENFYSEYISYSPFIHLLNTSNKYTFKEELKKKINKI